MTPCIEWQQYRTKAGYGIKKFKGKPIKAHRYMWITKIGPIPAGQIVRHRCDNRACVNIDHLELGTQFDNVMDCVTRGRHGGTKINAGEALSIRENKDGLLHRELADKYGIGRSLVTRIINRQLWAHV